MCDTGKLFRVDVSGDEIWDMYLSSFEEVVIFRDPNSSEHNCNCCKNFIRRYGNVVSVNSEGGIESMFSNLGEVGEYSKPSHNIDRLIKSKPISSVFFETYDELNSNLNYESCNKTQVQYQLGIAKNHKKYTELEVEKFGCVKLGEIYEFHHFNVTLPTKFVDKSGKSIERIIANYRDKYEVFKRGIFEIKLDSLKLVRDLINQGSLLDGDAHLSAIDDMIKYQIEFEKNKIDDDIWFWLTTYGMNSRIAKFRNTLIGTLCVDLSKGVELNKACRDWNKRVDPKNYHKAKAPITQTQINNVEKFVVDNGYSASFNRRLATIDDIKASEIKYMNVGSGEKPSISIFDNIKPTVKTKKAEFKNIEEISIEKFMSDVLPNCDSIEAYVKNNMEGNFVTLTTTNDEESKPIFKWDNNYSWTFNGNLAGKSQIKDAVKCAGGDVKGVLRFSIMWAENDGDNSDLDAHCYEPNNGHIYFSKKKSFKTGGNLDVDITNPKSQMKSGAVENITYPLLNDMVNGTYRFRVHQYRASNSKGFKAEVEFNGESYYYEYNKPVSGYIDVAEVTLKNGVMTIKHNLPEAQSSKEIWGVETNNFHKVNLVCLTPNHWGDNSVGNKHYLFMLEGCKPDSQIRTFHNENLIPELLDHKKVMEVLGSTNMVDVNDGSLAGIGFNSTVSDELIVKCSGSFNRMLKIKFK